MSTDERCTELSIMLEDEIRFQNRRKQRAARIRMEAIRRRRREARICIAAFLLVTIIGFVGLGAGIYSMLKPVSKVEVNVITAEPIPEPLIITSKTNKPKNATSVSNVNEPISDTVVVSIVEAHNHKYVCSKEDQEFFEQIMAAESYSFWSYDDILSLATVVINRYNNPDYPSDIRLILEQGKQFETFANGRYQDAVVTDECRRAVEDALCGKTNLNSDVLFFCTKEYYESCSESDFFKSLEHVYTCRNVYFFEEK